MPAKNLNPNSDPRLLRCWLYARKSNEQDASAEDKSTTRQIEHGTRFAKTIGGTVARVFEDDGISGTEFAKRPDLVALLAAAQQKPKPCDAVIMSEGSRLGRESIETAYIVKQLIKADIRVFNYLDGREITMNSPTEKLLIQLGAFADEMEVFRASQRITDVQTRRATEGRSNGGRCAYGYRDVVTIDGAGRRVVTQTIYEPEAVVVRRIYQRCADGAGYAMIAKELTADLIPVGQNATNRTAEIWKVGAIFKILKRTDYKGIKTWRRTSRSDQFQEDRWAARPESDWITAAREDLRIVSDELWTRAHVRIARRRERTRVTGRRDRGTESKYLLSGFVRCASCGGTMTAIKQNPANGRQPFVYVCRDRRVYGPDRCDFKPSIPMPVLDRLVLDRLQTYLTPDTVAAILDDATAERAPRGDVARWTKELATVDRKIANLEDAIENGGNWAGLRDRMTAQQTRRAELTDAITTASAVQPTTLDRQRAGKILTDAVARLRTRLDPSDVPTVRQLLRDMLQDRPIRVYNPATRGGKLGARLEPDLLMLLAPGALSKPLPDAVLLRLSSLRRSQQYTVLEAVAA
jgi:site-specific DNA recombinase